MRFETVASFSRPIVVSKMTDPDGVCRTTIQRPGANKTGWGGERVTLIKNKKPDPIFGQPTVAIEKDLSWDDALSAFAKRSGDTLERRLFSATPPEYIKTVLRTLLEQAKTGPVYAVTMNDGGTRFIRNIRITNPLMEQLFDSGKEIFLHKNGGTIALSRLVKTAQYGQLPSTPKELSIFSEALDHPVFAELSRFARLFKL